MKIYIEDFALIFNNTNIRILIGNHTCDIHIISRTISFGVVSPANYCVD